jgi:tRNA(Arg) A34 adenosine deaminase TadA
MCLSAIYWAGLSRICFANTKQDAEDIYFGDKFIYEEIERPISRRAIPTESFMREEALQAFRAWEAKTDKINY